MKPAILLTLTLALCACSTEMVIDEKPSIRDQRGLPSMGTILNPEGTLVIFESPTPGVCAPFVLNRDEILEFIRNPRRIPIFKPQYRQVGEPPLCAVAYQATTRNGRQVSLLIDETRRGVLHYVYPFDIPEEHYYCSNCKSPKYTVPMDDAPEATK